ncbi:hypothetical protein Dsin_032350 [Dipteronia sinensis]|uniref:Ubiquitin-like protease family profile domain-containing protein n=1 Tax=Dipteronia sinensis TaxID=43782 RepID=A0AAD9ZPI6_9ROSI|nr:hypothetical protein Dsin_032350 [Dipteronia sinensis]
MEVLHMDPHIHIQDHTADPSSPLGQSLSSRTVHTSDLTRRSIQRTPTVHPTPLSSTRSHRTSPLSDTTGLSRHSPPHRPNDLVDADQLAAYQACKRNVRGELCDVDLMTPVPVTWFHRLQTNFMKLEDTSMLEFQWQRIMPRDAVGKAPKNWSVLKYIWSPEDLLTVRGFLPVGNRPWHEVDAVFIPCNIGGQHWLVASVDLTVGKIHLLDPFRQEVPLQIRKEQVAPLRWFLPSMLHQVGFHDARPTGEAKYEKRNRPFGVSMVSTTHVPQQTRGYDCTNII